jgi:quercetin dioxygenase-like cupin family protein
VYEVAPEEEKGRGEDGAGGEKADALLIELQVGVVWDTHTHTHSHTIYIHIQIYVCIYICMYKM